MNDIIIGVLVFLTGLLLIWAAERWLKRSKNSSFYGKSFEDDAPIDAKPSCFLEKTSSPLAQLVSKHSVGVENEFNVLSVFTSRSVDDFPEEFELRVPAHIPFDGRNGMPHADEMMHEVNRFKRRMNENGYHARIYQDMESATLDLCWLFRYRPRNPINQLKGGGK